METVGDKVPATLRQVQLVPNPARNNFSLKNIPLNSENGQLSLIDAQGRVVFETNQLSGIHSVESLAAGLYLARIVNADGQRTMPLLIQR